jgi:hypothetical protein
MQSRHTIAVPPLSLGLSSITLGGIALALFILPILAMPVALGGVAVAIIALVRARFSKNSAARLAIVGLCISCLAFGVGFAIDLAPTSSRPALRVRDTRQTKQSAPYISPPLRPFYGRS